MALDAGVMNVTIEFAKDLKDVEWFGRQDPYCIVRVGDQQYRTRTAVDAGRDPVWNETFQFNIVNENDVQVEIKDSDVGRDDPIGTATFNLSRAREYGSDRVEVPVLSPRHRTEHGYLSVSLNWQPSGYLAQEGVMYGQQQPTGYDMPPPPVPYYEGGMPPQPPSAPGAYYPPTTAYGGYATPPQHHHHHHHPRPEVVEEVVIVEEAGRRPAVIEETVYERRYY